MSASPTTEFGLLNDYSRLPLNYEDFVAPFLAHRIHVWWHLFTKPFPVVHHFAYVSPKSCR